MLALPPEKLHKLRIGIFGRSPAADWLLQNGLIERAEMYAPQSGDPKETPDTIVDRDLSSGKIDVAVVWGPIAGQLVSQHSAPGLRLAFKPDPKIKFDYEISMGLRQGEKEWKETLDQWIGSTPRADQRDPDRLPDSAAGAECTDTGGLSAPRRRHQPGSVIRGRNDPVAILGR